MVVVILLLIYDIVALVLCFYAYREFKGMLFDAGVNAGGMMGLPGMGGGASQGNSYQASYAQDNRQ